MQGMNDIVAPLYYVMVTEGGPGWHEYAEADTFFCFVNLMAEIRDNFVKTLDNSATGILAWVRHLDRLLQAKDEELWTNLVRALPTQRPAFHRARAKAAGRGGGGRVAQNEKQLHPQFYSFRWLSLLVRDRFGCGGWTRWGGRGLITAGGQPWAGRTDVARAAAAGYDPPLGQPLCRRPPLRVSRLRVLRHPHVRPGPPGPEGGREGAGCSARAAWRGCVGADRSASRCWTATLAKTCSCFRCGAQALL